MTRQRCSAAINDEGQLFLFDVPGICWKCIMQSVHLWRRLVLRGDVSKINDRLMWIHGLPDGMLIGGAEQIFI